MMPDAEVAGLASGILLAGGRSSRFGRDKLLVDLDGRPLVQHAAEAVAGLVSELLVVVPPIGEPPPLPAAFGATPMRVIRDPEPFGGPLVALLAALERAREPVALVAAGDMPWLVPEVLRALLVALERGDPDAATLVQRSTRRPLPMAVRVGVATTAARAAIGDGERSLVALLRGLRVVDLAEADWRPLDPEARTLGDVDRPGDLHPAR